MAPAPVSTRHVVVLGVSGSGKTTVARGIAERTGLLFGEADDFHPAANVAAMSAGVPLTDADRRPWLEALARWMAERAAEGRSTVMACSALRRSYRDILRSGPPRIEPILLAGPAELIRRRMVSREGHFMPPSLLDSQVATLEPLEADEGGLVLDLRLDPEELLEAAVAWLGGPASG